MIAEASTGNDFLGWDEPRSCGKALTCRVTVEEICRSFRDSASRRSVLRHQRSVWIANVLLAATMMGKARSCSIASLAAMQTTNTCYDCTPNEGRCLDETFRESCDAAGRLMTSEDCEFGCDEVTGQCLVCEPLKRVCLDDNSVGVCKSNGRSFITTECELGCGIQRTFIGSAVTSRIARCRTCKPGSAQCDPDGFKIVARRLLLSLAKVAIDRFSMGTFYVYTFSTKPKSMDSMGQVQTVPFVPEAFSYPIRVCDDCLLALATPLACAAVTENRVSVS